MATTLFAKWTPLASNAAQPLSAALVRSSQSLAVVGNDAYIFGGELKPRTPVDATLTRVSLEDGSIEVLDPPTNGAWPSKRVGSSLVALKEKLYLWGGRGGKEMGTFGDDDVWRFDLASRTWEMLRTQGDKPEQRSFHVLSALDNELYVHAGCPSKGRLATLHSLDISTLTWTALASAPEPGRGGTVLAALGSPLSLFVRFGGFAGYELGGMDVFDSAKNKWTSVDYVVEGGGEGPGKRSVHALTRVEGGLRHGSKTVVAVMAHGEREGAPAELGHDGAGFFHDDAWALLATDGPAPSYSWLQLRPSSMSTETPEARGWFASSFWQGNKVVLQGGLNSKNERLGDGWVLEVVEELIGAQ